MVDIESIGFEKIKSKLNYSADDKESALQFLIDRSNILNSIQTLDDRQIEVLKEIVDRVNFFYLKETHKSLNYDGVELLDEIVISSNNKRDLLDNFEERKDSIFFIQNIAIDNHLLQRRGCFVFGLETNENKNIFLYDLLKNYLVTKKRKEIATYFND